MYVKECLLWFKEIFNTKKSSIIKIQITFQCVWFQNKVSDVGSRNAEDLNCEYIKINRIQKKFSRKILAQFDFNYRDNCIQFEYWVILKNFYLNEENFWLRLSIL